MNISISTIIAEEYGITANPGKKGECPFCHHPTFSVKRDDTLGKCFHPTCGRFLSGSQSNKQQGSIIYRIHEEIYSDFHRHLLSLQGSPERNAYNYCLNERGIHPKVISDSMLGAIPIDYDLNVHFAPYIEEAKDAVEAEQGEKPKISRPSKKKLPMAAERLNDLVEAQKKLEKCLKRHGGWLAFFYTDAYHRIVAIRFRKPYGKQILFYKPGKAGGVFNHGLYIPLESPERNHLNEMLIVVEGEFNLLQLQSLFIRIAESKGDPLDTCYVFSCAVGGVANADTKTIRKIASNPIVCYDNDSGGAGYALVENLLQTTSLTAFTTPEIDSDLDDYIRSFGSDIEKAYTSFKKLVSRRELHIRPFEAIKADIDNIRRSEGGKSGPKRFEVNRAVAEMIVSDLEDRGKFYHDNQRSYFFFNSEKRLIAIERDNQDLELTLSWYGVAPSEELYRYLMDALRLYAIEKGILTDVFSFSHYDQSSGNLYIYDFDQQIYRITYASVDRVDNGTDGVLFLHNREWKPYTMGTPKPNSSAFNQVILTQMRFREDGLSMEDKRLLFQMWFYCLFFPERFPTRPILAMIGEKGSGKTIALRKIGQLIFGSSFNVMQLSEDPKDFDAAVTNTPFVAIDNTDTKIRWLDDRLAVVATGGSIKRRELYTTNRLTEFPVCAFLGITSRTPHFRRDDVADRLLIFCVDRFETFLPESQLLAEVAQSRDEILTEVIGRLQEIVRVLQDEAGKTYASRFRMADFADFSLRIAHAEGWGERMESILERTRDEQSSFVIQDEPIMDLLEIWLSEKSGANIDREVTSAILCQELANIADSEKIDFWYKGKTRSFAQRLRNLKTALRLFYEIHERTGGGRRKYLSFRPKPSESSMCDA